MQICFVLILCKCWSFENDLLVPLSNPITGAVCQCQSKKRQYDQEVENLERQQKQTIERLEQEHTNRLREEAKRIKAEQDKELSKYQSVLKNHKKQVSMRSTTCPPPVQVCKRMRWLLQALIIVDCLDTTAQTCALHNQRWAAWVLNPPPPAGSHLFISALIICPLLFWPVVANESDGRWLLLQF